MINNIIIGIWVALLLFTIYLSLKWRKVYDDIALHRTQEQRDNYFQCLCMMLEAGANPINF